MRLVRLYGAGLVILVLLTAACATAYGPKNVTGGYVEEWRSPTELEVFFPHNDLLTVEQQIGGWRPDLHRVRFPSAGEPAIPRARDTLGSAAKAVRLGLSHLTD